MTPTCGFGSLSLKVADEAPRGVAIYGQEKGNATWALCRMNLILHDNEVADIPKGDTITNPQFSVKSWSNGLEQDYGRFEFGRKS